MLFLLVCSRFASVCYVRRPPLGGFGWGRDLGCVGARATIQETMSIHRERAVITIMRCGSSGDQGGAMIIGLSGDGAKITSWGGVVEGEVSDNLHL